VTAGLPEVVPAGEWQRARDELLAAEKAATKALDELAARRRRLPMTEFAADYVFDTPDGPRTLLDAFDGHPQLVVYQFMDNGPETFCNGCSWYAANVPDRAPEILAQHGVRYLHVSEMPLARIRAYAAARGWTTPFFSSRGNGFARDTGADGGFLLSVFLRDGDRVFRTYATRGRGIDGLPFVTGILDLTPFGRQEDWEDTPAGRPQSPAAIVPDVLTPAEQPISFGRYR
jgi:predicted dithiol-disulfide oxidoreductase (DUF899 family)